MLAISRFHATQEPCALPRTARFRVAQPRSPFGDWVEGDVAVPSARRSRTSPITGIRLQRTERGWSPRLEPCGSRDEWNQGVVSPLVSAW